MASDPGPVIQRALLTAELQRLRRNAGKTQEEVARALEWSPSKLIRIEGGNSGISITDLHALLRRYGVTEEVRVEELSALARGARARGWWDPYKDDLKSPAYSDYIGYEGGASIIRQSCPLFIPGLLQTEEYARAVTIEFVPDEATLNTVIEVRLIRQDKMFNQEEPPEQHYVLDEAAIRRKVGGQHDSGIMPRQLNQLLDLATRPYITVELIPFKKGAHFGTLGEFVLLGFQHGPEGVLFLENGGARAGDLTVADSDLIAAYLESFEHLRKIALSAEESVDFIREVADEMRE
jgi:transcriptional regulator with XRE-family HTH domain